jgi:hypothetical protein
VPISIPPDIKYPSTTVPISIPPNIKHPSTGHCRGWMFYIRWN